MSFEKNISRAGNEPLPDLLIRVRLNEVGTGLGLHFELKAADPDLKLSFKSYGPHMIRRDPKSFFDHFFKDLEAQGRINGLRGRDRSELEYLSEKGLHLFEQVFPEDLQDELWRIHREIHTLQILTEEAWIPWELCKLQGYDGERFEEGPFFCEAFAMTRWFPGHTSRQNLPLRNIAVIGRQSGDLPKTREEVNDLLGFSKVGRKVEEIPAELPSMKHAMKGGRYDGWHFAGHGKKQGDHDGFALELDDAHVISPENITGLTRNMGKTHPFVFLNCCYSGRSGLSLTGINGWAEKFIKTGASTFIGTQWAVADEAAYRFSHAFYNRFLAGEPLGEAIRNARMVIRDFGDASWLAFTVYGDPLTRAHYTGPEPDLRRGGMETPPMKDRGAVEHKSTTGMARYVEDKSRHFVGRQFILEAIDNFIEQHPCGYIQVSAPSGFGKTALTAHLSRGRGYVHHFNIRLESHNRKAQFIKSLTQQLGARFPLQTPQEWHAGTLDPTTLLALASPHLTSGQKVVIILDALDESSRVEQSRNGNTLDLPIKLPRGIFFLVTSGDTVSLESESPIHRLAIKLDHPNHLADIHAFVETRSHELTPYLEKHSISPGGLAEALVIHGQGSFLYVGKICKELTRGVYKNRPISQLPHGLEAYYADRWEQAGRDTDQERRNGHLPFLSTMAIIKEALPLEVISVFAGLRDTSLTERLMKYWFPLIYSTPGTENGRQYRLDHESFRRFILKQAEQAGFNRQALHHHIVSVLNRALFHTNVS